MERLTNVRWRSFDPWECCGQDHYCTHGCHDEGGCTKGCIVPRLYARLAAYEDTGLEPEEIDCILDAYGRGVTLRTESMERLRTIKGIALERLKEIAEAEHGGRLAVQPPNEPLTLEELREMDGGPVFIVRAESDNPADRDWALVDLKHDMCKTVSGGMAVFELYGQTWLAYRRKKEEGT